MLKIARRSRAPAFTTFVAGAVYGRCMTFHSEVHGAAADLIGSRVIVRSAAGIEYEGHVRSISPLDDGGEMFELGRYGDVAYQRFVYVADREAQVRTPEARGHEAKRPR